MSVRYPPSLEAAWDELERLRAASNAFLEAVGRNNGPCEGGPHSDCYDCHTAAVEARAQRETGAALAALLGVGGLSGADLAVLADLDRILVSTEDTEETSR